MMKCMYHSLEINTLRGLLKDPRVLWDYVKYKIRQETIVYSKSQARERRATLTILERKIKIVK